MKVSQRTGLLLFLFTQLVLCGFAQNGIITANADPNLPVNGAPATAAQLNWPNDVAVDSAGNLYIANQANNRTRKITTAGIISMVAGNRKLGQSSGEIGKGNAGADGPVKPGPGVKNPVPITQPLPPYTEATRKAPIQGITVIQAIIRKNGKVDVIKFIKAPDGLDEAAIIDFIENKWLFQPGTKDGVPVDVIAGIEVKPDRIF
jgi:hypothetical protein